MNINSSIDSDADENYIIEYLDSINENSKCISYLSHSLGVLLELFIERVSYIERIPIMIKMIKISHTYMSLSKEIGTYQMISKVLQYIVKIEQHIPDTCFDDEYKRDLFEKIAWFKYRFNIFYSEVVTF